jgi:predicted alpha/beta-hydrolase family hydrolase
VTSPIEEQPLVIERDSGAVSALLLRPASARCLFVLAHGAGAGMRHPFLAAFAHALAERDVATLRYQFPYMEQGSRRPDPPRRLEATVRAAVALAARVAPELPLVAGGKSMGGRMTSQAIAAAPLAGVRGVCFVGFPLHPAGEPPNDRRAAHLASVDLPLLFLQGTRDELAELELMRRTCAALGPRARLHVVEGADHSFHVLKRSGRTDDQVLSELADAFRAFCDSLAA